MKQYESEHYIFNYHNFIHKGKGVFSVLLH